MIILHFYACLVILCYVNQVYDIIKRNEEVQI